MADPARPELANHLDIEPASFLVDVEEGAFEIELVLMSPSAWVEVEVIGIDGAPVSGSTVQAVLTRLVEEEGGPVSAGQHGTDTNGRARVAVYEGAYGARLELHARLGQDLVSEKRTLEPPWPSGPARLVLERGGRVRATLVDDQGEPLAGRFVGIAQGPEGRAPEVGLTSTDGDGVALFPTLPAGEYRVFHYDEAVRRTYETEVLLPAGGLAEARLEARLPTERAAAGRVVDEAGAPLSGVSVRLERPGEGDLFTTTGNDGSFAFDAPRAETVRVGPHATPWADEYDPPAAEVPFGTSELSFQRVGVPAEAAFSIEVVDGSSGVAVDEAIVLGFRTATPGEYGLHRAPGGRIALSYKAHADLAFAVHARGFKRRIVPASELDRRGASRIELAPGYARTLEVRHELNDEPLMGARVVRRRRARRTQRALRRRRARAGPLAGGAPHRGGTARDRGLRSRRLAGGPGASDRVALPDRTGARGARSGGRRVRARASASSSGSRGGIPRGRSRRAPSA